MLEAVTPGKPRPVLIVQADALGALSSVVVIPLTTFGHEASIVRPAMGASPDNGLDQDSFVMLDKVVAIPRTTDRSPFGQRRCQNPSSG